MTRVIRLSNRSRLDREALVWCESLKAWCQTDLAALINSMGLNREVEPMAEFEVTVQPVEVKP